MERGWYQQVLTNPEVIEARLSVGVVPSADHVQVQIDVLDPTNGILIAQWSAPHVRLHEARRLLEEAAGRLAALLEEYCDPF